MHITKIANLADQSNDSAFEIFEVRKLGRGTCLLRIEREKSRTPDSLHRELVKSNVAMPTDRRTALEALVSIIEQEPLEQWIYAETVGWREDERAFLLGDRLIGDIAGIRVFPPGGPTPQTRIGFHHRGNLATWRYKVAAASLTFPPWVAALSAAFAAPLLAPCRWPSFRLHLFGGTDLRRMAAVAVAGSAVGFGRRHITQLSQVAVQQVPTIAKLLTDLVVPVAETNADLAGPARGRSMNIADRLLAGATVGDVGLFIPEAFSWRGTLVSAAAEAVHSNGLTEALFITGSEPFTLDLPVSLAVWGQQQVTSASGSTGGKLLRTCDEHSGLAYRRYIKFLIAKYADLPKMAKAFAAEFRAAVTEADRDLLSSPVMVGFERLYAGGAMAIAARVVPWKQGELSTTLIACLRASHAHANRHTTTLTTLRKQLKDHLRHIDLVGKHDRNEFGPEQGVGLCRWERGERVFTIHGKSFRDWFANRAQRVAVIRWLHEAGHLRMGERKYRPSPTSTEWAERSVRWPDGRAHRSYVFRDPFCFHRSTAAAVSRRAG